MPLSPITGRPVVPPLPSQVPSRAQLKRAEAQLKLAGFSPGAVDGVVTPAFTKSLTEFQSAWGLPPSGQLDAATTAKLQHTADRIKAHRKDGFVSVGEKSKDVRVIENRLRALGYDAGKADGVYDRSLGKAVLAFRKDQRDVADGLEGLGKQARSSLAKEVAALRHAPQRRRLPPSAAQTRLDRATAEAVLRARPDGSKGLREGDTGRAVSNLQAHLRAAGFDPKSTAGTFDERTGGMVKQFQAKSGLPVSGVVDAPTWRALQKSYLLSKNPASPPQALNERSGAVKASEALLKKLGYNPGKIDGLFDKNTLRAVRAYEKRRHLKVDGQISAPELVKMKKDYQAQNDWRKRTLDTARRWLGFHERGVDGNPFSRYFGRGPEAWCADFVSYCYTKAGKKLNEPYTPTLLSMLHQNGTYHRSNPKPGDIVMFDWNRGDRTSAMHTGLVERVYKSGGQWWVQTIEGNSSNSVKRNDYPVSDPNIVGFGTMG